MSKKIISVLLLAMVLVFGLTACGKQESTASKVLKVGTDASYAPFGFQDEKTKDYIGFDIDLIKAVAKQAGIKVEINNLNFDGLIPALQTGNLDIAISDMTIDDERSQKVGFSKSYYKAGLGIVVRADTTDIKSVQDLAGKTVAVSIGSTGAEAARKIENVKIREFNTIADAFLDLKAGGVDAVINDIPVNEYYVLQDKSETTKTVDTPINSEDLGIAVAKNNTELLAKIDKGLMEIKQNGEYEKIYRKWFGKLPVE